MKDKFLVLFLGLLIIQMVIATTTNTKSDIDIVVRDLVGFVTPFLLAKEFYSTNPNRRLLILGLLACTVFIILSTVRNLNLVTTNSTANLTSLRNILTGCLAGIFQHKKEGGE